MEFHRFCIFALFSVLAMASHAVLSPEEYWKSVLPTTPIPKSITQLLPSPGTKGLGKIDIYQGGCFTCPRVYSAAESADESHDVNLVLQQLFWEKDIYQGARIKLNLTKTKDLAPFLPRKIADSIPFSSQNLPQILNQLSIKPDTINANIIARTIKECEVPETKGEMKRCATSLESMVDFITEKLGTKIEAVSTDVQTESETGLQEYKIVGVKKSVGNTAGICHKFTYAYGVFLCHTTNTVKAYTVSLVAKDGTKATAVGVCHMDTSSWNPKHIVFQLLKVKPGSVPVCHFLGDDNVVFVQDQLKTDNAVLAAVETFWMRRK